MELEKVREALYELELVYLTLLEYEINTFKDQMQISKLRHTQDTLATDNTLIKSSSIKQPKEKETTISLQKSYTQIALWNLLKVTTEKVWTKVTSSSQRQIPIT